MYFLYKLGYLKSGRYIESSFLTSFVYFCSKKSSLNNNLGFYKSDNSCSSTFFESEFKYTRVVKYGI